MLILILKRQKFLILIARTLLRFLMTERIIFFKIQFIKIKIYQ